VHTINNNGLVGTQFEEGVYISDKEGKRINIYQFDNNIDLVRVLAHELGHSLRLQHNANTNSIMNPLNQGQDLSLSPEDLQELKTACGLSQNQ
jgi:predicted Zn-dependent protease